MGSLNPDIVSSPPLDNEPIPAIYHETIRRENVDPDAVKVISRLNRHGHTAYLVGGGVRDLLLDRRPKDYDVATSARPEEVRRIFRNCRIIGRRFRLAHILFANGKIIETATFRRDPMQSFDVVEGEFLEEMEAMAEEHSRLVPSRKDVDDDADLLIKHDNIFGEPHEDAIRRDFTINGLFYDLEEDVVIDYVGGVPDLRRNLVRTIGNPAVRLREDPIRILRAIKFSARLDLGIEPELYDAIVEHRTDLLRAARPRLLEEIFRLLRGGAAQRSVYLMWDCGVLAVMLPELASYLDDDAPGVGLLWRRLAAIDRRQLDGELPSDSVLIAALLQDAVMEWLEDAKDPSRVFEEFFAGIGERLTVPRRIKDRVRSILSAQRRIRSGKLGALPRRDFFDDAATLYALECEAMRRPIPDWVREPDGLADEPVGRTRSRRKRRGR